MEMTLDKFSVKHWRGRSRDRVLVTVFDIGDDYYCWDSGILWEIRDIAHGWEPKFRTVPLPVKIDPDTYEPEV